MEGELSSRREHFFWFVTNWMIARDFGFQKFDFFSDRIKANLP